MPKVLLTDDDTALTRMLTKYLEGEGFEATAASNGTEGAVAALDLNLDAMILDIMMADISGLEMLQPISWTSSVPVIMLTARGSEDDRAFGLVIGAMNTSQNPITLGSCWGGSMQSFTVNTQ